MIVDFAAIAPAERYRWMVGCVIPRPIAWVVTENDDGSHNLAPFSYFNAVASAPPVLMISIGRKPGTDAPKDTARNILARECFVVCLPAWSQLAAMNETSRELAYGVGEAEAAGVDWAPFPGAPLPRVAGAPVAFACRLHAHLAIGPQTVVFGRIERLWIDDAVLADRGGRVVVDDERLDPIARLGLARYARLGERVTLPRPKGE